MTLEAARSHALSAVPEARESVPPRHAFEAALDDLLRLVRTRKASDVHFEPRGEHGGGEIRLRVAGRLSVVRTFADPLQWDDLLKEVKRRARLAFHKGTAQDGRFTHLATNTDFRVSLIPTVIGGREAERIVLRAIPRDGTRTLESLGLPPPAVTALKAALGKNAGLVIVTGPTGSGKSVTLAGALGAIDRDTYSVLTLEDPVEMAIPGVSQSQTSERFSFAHGLRAFLRQDPDYILVGETRDGETAKILLQAANTGHVVLTTLHTNSAAEAFGRLAALGADETLARECATFVCAQRLASKLCPHCTEEETDLDLRARLHVGFPELEAGFVPRRARGCDHCHGTGLSGRVLLFEFIAPVRGEDGRTQLTPFGSLRSDALRALKEGLIDAGEALSFT